MDAWFKELVEASPMPVAILLVAILAMWRMIGSLVVLLRPAVSNDIREIKRIVQHLDVCIDEVKEEQKKFGERLSFLEGRDAARNRSRVTDY